MLKNKNLLFLFIIILFTLLPFFKCIKPIYSKIVLSNPQTELNSNTHTNISCFIRGYCTRNSDLFLIFDEIEFFVGTDAKKEYRKDNSEEALFEWGNDYYIRNSSKEMNLYKISPTVKIELCSFAANLSTNSIELTPVSVDIFKKYVDNSLKNSLNERALLFSIDIKNNTIVNIRMIFTP